MSWQDFEKEPAREVRKAFLIWSLDNERDTLELERLDN